MESSESLQAVGVESEIGNVKFLCWLYGCSDDIHEPDVYLPLLSIHKNQGGFRVVTPTKDAPELYFIRANLAVESVGWKPDLEGLKPVWMMIMFPVPVACKKLITWGVKDKV